MHSMVQMAQSIVQVHVHARNCRGRGTSCMPAGLAIFFFFWIRGSTNLRRFERILGGSGSIRVSMDSFYPYSLGRVNSRCYKEQMTPSMDLPRFGLNFSVFEKDGVCVCVCVCVCLCVCVEHGGQLITGSSQGSEGSRFKSRLWHLR